MPTKQKDDEPTTPTTRTCATDRVHERLLRECPGYAERRALSEDQAWRADRTAGAAGRTGCTTIPVVVHVVHRTNAENISDAQVASQIEILTADFRKQNADVSTLPGAFAGLSGDARVTFELASTDPDGNPTDGITRTRTSVNGFTDDDAVKSAGSGGADAWPADQFLNVWVCRLAGGLLGYAQFPGGPAATDGVVITHTSCGNTGTAAPPFNLGRTATHEVGHWLNLRHIWGDDGTGCNGTDFVDDTPNQGGANVGKPAFPHVSCDNGPNGDLFMNYMDYVDDDTMVMFTNGQVTRMQATLDGMRSSIGTSGPCDGGGTIKFVDDPIVTLKFNDDPGSLKFRDDPSTLKFRDDPGSLKFRDDPVTLKFSDDPGTLKFRDDPITLKFRDDPGSLKFSDDPGTLKFRDDPVKHPVLDKPPPQDVVKPPVADLPIPGPGPVVQPAPFVLSTGHHSRAWEGTYEGAYHQTIAHYQAQLQEYEQMLNDYASAEQAGQLTEQERGEADQLYAAYEQLSAELAQLQEG